MSRYIPSTVLYCRTRDKYWPWIGQLPDADNSIGDVQGDVKTNAENGHGTMIYWYDGATIILAVVLVAQIQSKQSKQVSCD